MIATLRRYFARRRIRRAWGNQVSPQLVEQMVESGREPAVSSSSSEITPFFANVQGYVGIAEQVPLARLPELMNAWFEACTSAIEEEGGTLDKYVGDVVVGMFGAPLQLPDHALHGCVAALKSQARVTELRAKLQRDPNPWPDLARQFRVRIGLHTGVAIVGNIGSRTRFNYTMLGDNVNLAARLESGAKSWGVWTLCTGATHDACERAAPGRVVFRRLGVVVVKGRTAGLALYEPAALREDATDQLRECIALFEAGLARYMERDWAGAIQHFEKSSGLERDQPGASPEIKLNPSTLYLDLARECQANPGTEPPPGYTTPLIKSSPGAP
jgi:adenylate cyclase